MQYNIIILILFYMLSKSSGKKYTIYFLNKINDRPFSGDDSISIGIQIFYNYGGKHITRLRKTKLIMLRAGESNPQENVKFTYGVVWRIASHGNCLLQKCSARVRNAPKVINAIYDMCTRVIYVWIYFRKRRTASITNNWFSNNTLFFLTE